MIQLNDGVDADYRKVRVMSRSSTTVVSLKIFNFSEESDGRRCPPISKFQREGGLSAAGADGVKIAIGLRCGVFV